jgi:hypothetical protein
MGPAEFQRLARRYDENARDASARQTRTLFSIQGGVRETA